MTEKFLSLSEALSSDRLDEFIDQAEAQELGSANLDEFLSVAERLIKAPRPKGQTSR